MDHLYDKLRNKNVKITPEEIIRNRFINLMVSELGYPKGLIIVEKALNKIDLLIRKSEKKLPVRRIDILACNLNKQKSVEPLLLIECKAIAFTSAMLRQVVGYNHFINAPFLALVNSEKVLIMDTIKSKIINVSTLPTYKDLVDRVLD